MSNKEEMITNNEIWIVTALNGDQTYSKQLISKGRTLADYYKKKLIVMEFSTMSDEEFHAYTRCGADTILYYGHQQLPMEDIKSICCRRMRDKVPMLMMGCSHDESRALFSSIATRLELGLTADIVEVGWGKKDELIFSRTAINASTMANIISTHQYMQMCTVKKDVFTIEMNEDRHQTSHVIYCQHESCEEIPKRDVLQLISEKAHNINHQACDLNSQVILGIGRGAISSMDKIHVLANALKIDIGVTRSLVDMGMFGHEKQIGQSGHSVTSKTYVAFGISGAAQHIVGLKNVGQIIAVNKDANAPIFNYADIAIVDDVDNICNSLLGTIQGR